jgi:hypothetical protein
VSDALPEIRDLLAEIRDLLRPVADAYAPEFRTREAVRARLSTDSRKAAWDLASGALSQRQIAKAAGIDEGTLSKLFKELREVGAIAEGPNPRRLIEI